ncbi:hypothetical protein E2C01_079112 [Portunus trituberculatus]|uniref:Uncharacterized protein n=1 Tax=Portunus trituberculatus TaxID=210409 RepID=A0A5B7IVZ5_PORTR|nr:hypothetical protein [Portunus trituberculatus]
MLPITHPSIPHSKLSSYSTLVTPGNLRQHHLPQPATCFLYVDLFVLWLAIRRIRRACRCLLLLTVTSSLFVAVTAVSAAARIQPAMLLAHRWALHHLFSRPHMLSEESVLRLDAGESLGVPTTIRTLYVLSAVMVSVM